MKTLLLIAVSIIAYSNSVVAQSYTERMSMQEDFFMLKISEQEFWTIHRNNIVRYTAEGDTISIFPVNFPNNYVKTFYTEVNNSQTIRLFVVLGYVTDLQMIQSYNSLLINSTGEILENKIILNEQIVFNELNEEYFTTLPIQTIKVNENKFLIQLEDFKIVCFDSLFNILWIQSLDVLQHLVEGFNGKIYITSQYQYLEIDENGNILNSTPIDITNTVEIDDGIFLRAGYYSAHIFNNSGATLYENTEVSRLNYLGRKDSLIILSSSKFFNAVAETDSSFIYILNDQLEVLYTYQFNNPRSMRFVQGLNPGNFIAFENHFISKINQEHKTAGWMEAMYSYGFKSFGYNLQEVNHSKDIGISGVNCFNFNVIPQGGNNPIPYMVSANCSVLVKNFSQDTISNFFINYYDYPGVAHGCSCFSWYVDSLDLSPNEEIEIPINQVLFDRYFMNYPTIVQYCICTSTPNHLIDANYSNDCHCETFQITNTQELENHFHINIFPNPGNGVYHIKDENMDLRYPLMLEVYNMQGAKVKSEQLNSSEVNFKLDVASGLFLVSLKDESGKQFRSKLFHSQP